MASENLTMNVRVDKVKDNPSKVEARLNLTAEEIEAYEDDESAEVDRILAQLAGQFGEKKGFSDDPYYGFQKTSLPPKPLQDSEANLGAKTVVETGLGGVTMEQVGTMGNSVPFLPRAEQGVVTTKDVWTPVGTMEMEIHRREAQAEAKEAPRGTFADTRRGLFAAMHPGLAQNTLKISIHGILVQLAAVELALQSGARASTLPIEPFDVVEVAASDVNRLRSDPAWANYQFLADPGLSIQETGVLATLLGPGGMSNFVWSWDDPDDDAGFYMHAVERNRLRCGYQHIAIGTLNPLPGIITTGGRALTLGFVRQLMHTCRQRISQREIDSAYASAMHYVRLYVPPRRDEGGEPETQVGSRIQVEYPGERAPPRQGPGVLRDLADGAGPGDGGGYFVLQDGQIPIIPRFKPWASVAPRLEAALRARIAEEWPGHGHGPVDLVWLEWGGLQVTCNYQWDNPPLGDVRWEAGADGWIAVVNPSQRVLFGWEVDDVWNWAIEFGYDSVRAPIEREPRDRGPYSAARNVYGGIDSETTWVFPDFNAYHVVGWLSGYFVPLRWSAEGKSWTSPELEVLSCTTAARVHWFMHRAFYVRGIDPVTLLRSEQAGGWMISRLPRSLYSLVYPQAFTRGAYPWPTWECLELPLVSAGDDVNFIGYGVGGSLDTDVNRRVNCGADYASDSYAKLDAYGRVVLSTYRRLPFTEGLGANSYCPYTVTPSGGRIYHNFSVPFIFARREALQVYDPFALRQALSDAVRIETPALSILDPTVDFRLAGVNVRRRVI